MSMNFKWVIGAVVAAALLAVPSGAVAKGRSVEGLAAQQCQQERHDIGRRAFAKKYGKTGMRACIRRTRAAVVSATQQAQQSCQAELVREGSAAFIDEYGSDSTGSDAMDECVAEGVDGALNPDDGSDDGTDDG
jgi:hypothetical protein